jgi:hypothetical protein
MVFNFYFTTKKVQHTTACLIQGLNQLGHKIYANYRPENSVSNAICPPFSVCKPDYIEQSDEFKTGVVIVDNSFGLTHPDIDFLNQVSKSLNVVIINMNDDTNYLPQLTQFHIFQGHYNSILPRKGETFPSAFGLSKEILEYSTTVHSRPREMSLLHNFRPSDNQGVRGSLMLSLLPNLRKYFKINTEISHPEDYSAQLLSHQAVFCYGGFFYTDLRHNDSLVTLFKDYGIERFDFKHTLKSSSEAVVFRFDSWRLYEAALFGAAPITLNFEKYGLETGANPRPWIEYIPVEFDKVESLPLEILSRLKEDPEFLIKVGQNARRWVIENHTPVPTAKRFIRKLEEINILP